MYKQNKLVVGRWMVGVFLLILSPNVVVAQDRSEPSDGSKRSKAEVQSIVDRQTNAIPDGIVAKVNEEVIFASEIMENITPRLKVMAKNLSKRKFKKRSLQVFRRELANVVERKVIIKEAKEAGISVSDKELEKLKQKEMKQAGSEADFQAYLKQTGMTEEEWKKEKRKQLLTRKLVSNRLFGAPSLEKEMGQFDTFVSPREIRSYYRNNKEEFRQEPQVKGILVRFSYRNSDEKDERRQQLKGIRRQISQGADFSKIAQVYASDRYVTKRKFDWINKGVFSKKVEEWLFDKAKIGEVEGPMEVDGEFVMLKVVDRKPGKQLPLTEVQEEIRQTLRSRKINENLDEMRQKMLEEAYIWPEEILRYSSNQ